MRDISFIEEKLDLLRDSEKKVYRHILASPETVIHLSICDLADKAQVSEPTVLRFCKALGFKGYQAFKIHLAQSLVPQLQTIHESVDGTESSYELAEKVFNSNVGAITKTLKLINPSLMETIIRLISTSQKIILHGLGGSAAVAMDAYHKFFRIGIPCHWYEDTHMAIMAASMMKEGEIFVAISHSGASRDIVDALRHANAVGAETIAIVTTDPSPVSKASKYVLRVDSPETNVKFEPMSSRIAQLCIIDAISVGVSLMRNKEVLNNLHKTREALIDKRY